MFLIGEWMAIDNYRKGLAHFQNEHRAYWSISTSGGTDFYFDYGQREIVLRTRTLTGDPLEIPFVSGIRLRVAISQLRRRRCDLSRDCIALVTRADAARPVVDATPLGQARARIHNKRPSAVWPIP